MNCPECGGLLIKKEDTGEGAKHCSVCGWGWFILNTSRPKDFVFVAPESVWWWRD